MNPEKARRILVADDTEHWRSSLLRALFRGCSVDEAVDAKSAIALAREHDYDLITLDNQMPEGHYNQGIYAAREIKAMERHRDTPILLITGDPGFEIVTEALAAGVEEVMHKPIDLAYARERIQHYFAKSDA